METLQLSAILALILVNVALFLDNKRSKSKLKNGFDDTLTEPMIKELRARVLKLEQELDSLQLKQSSFKLEVQQLVEEANLQFKRAAGKMAQIEKAEQRSLDEFNQANMAANLFNQDFSIPNSTPAQKQKTFRVAKK